MLLDHPGDDRSLADWGAIAGASGRTLERLFRAETGMTLHHWRQQARLLASLERIADHQPVATVALDLGFRSQSAFIAMFKKYLGKTPRRYFSS
jgi:AraC-like DNA-binding protein